MAELTLRKKHYDALEKLFAAEIDAALTRGIRQVQSKARVFKELEAAGYAQFVEELMPFRDGLPPMTIAGWVLTELGRLTYSISCNEVAANG